MSPLASTAYDAHIDEPVGSRRVLDLVLWPVRIIAAGLGMLDETTFGDVVVRRQDDTEVLRIPVTGTEESAQQLAVIREQLDSLTLEEFDAEWSITG